MLVHVTRCSVPRHLEDYDRQLRHHGATALEQVLDGTIADWSLPASTMTGHPVWFQVTTTSVDNVRHLAAEARAARRRTATRHIDELAGLVDEHAGNLVAVAQVKGEAVRGTRTDNHFRQYLFAPLAKVTRMRHPVPATGGADLCELGPFTQASAQRTNRALGGDAEYTQMLAIVRAAGNRVPAWADVSVDQYGDWWTAANDTTCSWLLEDQVAVQFAVPLLRELADGRRVHREVTVRADAARSPRGVVDALITVDRTPLPVEFKLNHRTEADLGRQLAKYSGPATLTKTHAALARSWRTEHPYVAVVDTHGVHLYSAGQRVGHHTRPLLPRGLITPETVAKLRAKLATKIS